MQVQKSFSNYFKYLRHNIMTETLQNTSLKAERVLQMAGLLA